LFPVAFWRGGSRPHISRTARSKNCRVEELPSRRTAESKNCQIDEPPKSLRIVEPTPLEARKVGAIEGDFVDAMKRFVVRTANCAGQWRSAAFPPLSLSMGYQSNLWPPNHNYVLRKDPHAYNYARTIRMLRPI
jgi:hypothetical protein